MRQISIVLLQRAQFETNFRNTLIENYGSAFAKYTQKLTPCALIKRQQVKTLL